MKIGALSNKNNGINGVNGGKNRKEIYVEEVSGSFVLLVKSKSHRKVCEKLKIVFEKKRYTLHLSKGLVSGKIN